jgi:hypothetical protein
MSSNPKDNPTFNLEGIPPFTVGVPQKVDLEPTSGKAPYKCDVSRGDLPDGLSFSSDGILSGTGRTANDSNPPTIWFRVTDSRGTQGTRAYQVIVVNSSGPDNRVAS